MRSGVTNDVSFHICALIHMIYFLTNQILNPLDVDFLEPHLTSTEKFTQSLNFNSKFLSVSFRQYLVIVVVRLILIRHSCEIGYFLTQAILVFYKRAPSIKKIIYKCNLSSANFLILQ